MNQIRRDQWKWVAMMVCLAVSLAGCSASKGSDDPSDFAYEEPPPPPLEEPEILPAYKFIRDQPSGRFTRLLPSSIAVISLSNYIPGSDPRPFLQNEARKSKQAGGAYLPYHFYVSPEGEVYGGVEIEHAGMIGGRTVDSAILVGVLGNYEPATSFPPEVQMTTLVQLCAWLCVQYSIQPGKIIPVTELDPSFEPLGTNLANYFGPTQMLVERVNKTLYQGQEERIKQLEKEKGFIGSMMKDPFERDQAMMQDF